MIYSFPVETIYSEGPLATIPDEISTAQSNQAIPRLDCKIAGEGQSASEAVAIIKTEMRDKIKNILAIRALRGLEQRG